MSSIVTLHAAPGGNDSNPGTAGAPLLSLRGARDAVRKIRASAPGAEVEVLFESGIYRMTETVRFGLEDSGPVRYAAAPGAEPIFTGAAAVTGWKLLTEEPDGLPRAVRGKLRTAPLPSGVDPRRANALFSGMRMLPRARGAEFSPVADPEGTPEKLRLDSIRYPDGALADWPDLENAELVVIPNRSWTIQILPVSRIDAAARTVYTAVPHTYPMLPSAPAKGPIRGAAAWVENVLAVLDSPGEWVVDRKDGTIIYWPADGEPGDAISVSSLTELVRVEGEIDYDDPADTPVRGISFSGFTFTGTARYPWHGQTGWGIQHDWEAFDRPTAMVRFRGAEDCAVSGCRFTGGAGAAVRLDLHCRGNRVSGNVIEEIGGCGVLLCGYGPGTKDVNNGNIVEDNVITGVGSVTRHAPAIFVWQSGGNLIRRNTIRHTPYSAVVVSGRIQWDRTGRGECSRTVRWHETARVVGSDYEKPVWHQAWYPDWKRREPLYHGRNNVLEGNEITDVMEAMGDGNGIYVSGAGGGNILRRNRIHDCPSPLMYEAIRCDDDQHGTLIEGNVIYRIGGAAIGIANKGLNDIVGNIVACPLSAMTHRAMISLECGPLHGVKVRRNIIYTTARGQRLYYQGPRLHGEGPLPLLRD